MNDLISRAKAIEAFEKFIYEMGIEEAPYIYGDIVFCEANVPSAEKAGKWEEIGIPGWKCSCCGEAIVLNIKLHGNYCPNCGARMRGEEGC